MVEQENNTESEKIPFLKGIFQKWTRKQTFITIATLFLIWVAFFDDDSFLERYRLVQEQKQLLETKEDLESKIAEKHAEIDSLNSAEYIEKVAREKHLMKKENEDIYIITKPEHE